MEPGRKRLSLSVPPGRSQGTGCQAEPAAGSTRAEDARRSEQRHACCGVPTTDSQPHGPAPPSLSALKANQKLRKAPPRSAAWIAPRGGKQCADNFLGAKQSANEVRFILRSFDRTSFAIAIDSAPASKPHFMRQRTASKSRCLTDKYDPGFERNATVQVLYVVVHEPNASGSDEVPYRLRRICSVDNQPGLVQQERA
jgi:hypothetical protein